MIKVDDDSISFIFDKKDDIKEIIQVEVRSNGEDWKPVGDYELKNEPVDDAKILIVRGLDENTTYDVRLVVKETDDKKIIFHAKEINTGWQTKVKNIRLHAFAYLVISNLVSKIYFDLLCNLEPLFYLLCRLEVNFLLCRSRLPQPHLRY